jgi:hypothetical protein
MLLDKIRVFARSSLVLRKFIAFNLTPSGFFDNVILNYKLNDTMQRRLDETCASPDNAKIPRVEKAGEVVKGKQIMHNGIKINLGSYYGPEIARILFNNKGVHEPQEEYVFSIVLKSIPEGATMIEMGSFWSFYSMWFQKVIPKAKNFMIEPDPFNIVSGKKNFRLNRFKGNFTQAFVGGKSGKIDGIKMVSVDDFVDDKKIEFIHILHSDIQGFEYDMLQGAQKTIDAKRIGYIFLSTHTNELHYQCLDFLKSAGFKIIATADLNQTYSEDGLIVARAESMQGEDRIEISLNKNLK